MRSTTRGSVIKETICMRAPQAQTRGSTSNTVDASLGVAFNERQVKQLPLEGRNVPDLLTLQASVVHLGTALTSIEISTPATPSAATAMSVGI
jgi:hypothetical protein